MLQGSTRSRRQPADARFVALGSSQQKVVVAREIDRDPQVLVAAQPATVSTSARSEFVHRRLVQERDEGRAILLVSLELEEVSRSPTAFS